MTNFLHDLWYDLRAKRLWPIAAALLVGLVAVPLFLLRPSAAPAPADAPAGAASAAQAGQLKTTTAADEASSELDVFKGKDPFRGPAGSRKAGRVVAAPPVIIPSAPAAPTSASGASGKPSGGGPRKPSGGTATPGPKAAPPKIITPERRAYTYVLDATFAASGEARRIRTMRRFRMLPSAKAPFLVFLGVDASGRRAVFLVDSRLKQTGEGSCRPSRRHCTFLYLEVEDGANEHFFTGEDGTGYSLELNGIRRSALTKASAKAARKRALHASSGGARTFVPPILVDLATGAE